MNILTCSDRGGTDWGARASHFSRSGLLNGQKGHWAGRLLHRDVLSWKGVAVPEELRSRNLSGCNLILFLITSYLFFFPERLRILFCILHTSFSSQIPWFVCVRSNGFTMYTSSDFCTPLSCCLYDKTAYHWKRHMYLIALLSLELLAFDTVKWNPFFWELHTKLLYKWSVRNRFKC